MAAGSKGAEEKGTGSPSLGETKDTPLVVQGSMRPDWGHRSLLGLWLGTWRSLRGWASKWSSWDQQQAQRAWDQPMQKQVGTELAKRHCWHLPGGTTGIIHAQNQKKKKICCRLSWDQPQKRKQTFPLSTTTWHRVQGKGLKWLHLEMKRLHCLHTSPYYC